MERLSGCLGCQGKEAGVLVEMEIRAAEGVSSGNEEDLEQDCSIPWQDD